MIARLLPDASQLRFWAQSALNGFETLDPATAAEVAQADMRALLAYLDTLEGADAVTVSAVMQVEPRVTFKLGRG